MVKTAHIAFCLPLFVYRWKTRFSSDNYYNFSAPWKCTRKRL